MSPAYSSRTPSPVPAAHGTNSKSTAGLLPNLAFQEALERHLASLSESQKVILHKIAADLGKAKDEALMGIEAAAGPTWVKPLVDLLDKFFAFIKHVVDVFPDVAKVVWASLYMVVRLAKRHVRFFEKINKTLQQVTLDLNYYEGCNILFFRWKNVQRVLVEVYDRILGLFMLVYRVLKRPDGKDRHRLSVTLQPFNPALRKFKQLEDESKDLRQEIERLSSQSEATHDRIGEFLKGLNPGAGWNGGGGHEKYSTTRLPGSGRWLLESRLYLSWYADDPRPTHNILWCYGKPGCGKTILASVIIDDLKAKATGIKSGRVGAAYLYWSRTHNRQGLPDGLRAIAHELMLQLYEPGEHTFLLELITKHHLVQHGAYTPGALVRIITQISKAFDRTYLVFDGLDEVEEDQSREALQVIRTLADRNIKGVVFSCDREVARTILKPCIEVPLQPDTVHEDLEQFVADGLLSINCLKHCNMQLRQDVEQMLLKGSSFLWVSNKLRDLSLKHSAYEVQELLDATPRTMKEEYASAMARITSLHPTEKQRAFTVIRWLLAAARPLTLDELAEAVALHEMEFYEHHKWKPEHIIDDPRILMNYCHPLCCVENDKVVFVHASAVRYLETYKAHEPGLLPSHAGMHVMLADICAAVQSSEGPQELKLRDYCMQYLDHHKEHSGESQRDTSPPPPRRSGTLELDPPSSAEHIRLSLIPRTQFSVSDLRPLLLRPDGNPLRDDTIHVLLRRFDDEQKGALDTRQAARLIAFVRDHAKAFSRMAGVGSEKTGGDRATDREAATGSSESGVCLKRLIVSHGFNPQEIDCLRILELPSVSVHCRQASVGDEDTRALDFDAFVVIGSVLRAIRRRFPGTGGNEAREIKLTREQLLRIVIDSL